MNKKLITCLLSTAFIFCGADLNVSQAMAWRQEEPAMATKYINNIEGKWYDHKGNLVLNIYNGSINGQRLIAVYNIAGSRSMGNAIFKTTAGKGTRAMKLSWVMNHNSNDQLKYNDSIILHRTARVPFYESVAGIHLGMTPDEVRETIGGPSQMGRLSPELNIYGWYYEDKRIFLTFDGDNVNRIIMLRGSNVKLHKSGLNCNNAPNDFADAYHLNRVPDIDYGDRGYTTGGSYKIADNEYLTFGNHMSYIMLSPYFN